MGDNWGPEEEAKHPRDRRGRFTDASGGDWADKVSNAMGFDPESTSPYEAVQAKMAGWPREGRKVTLQQLADMDIALGPEDNYALDGIEVWDEEHAQWRDGGTATLEPPSPASGNQWVLYVDDPSERGYEAEIRGSALIRPYDTSEVSDYTVPEFPEALLLGEEGLEDIDLPWDDGLEYYDEETDLWWDSASIDFNDEEEAWMIGDMLTRPGNAVRARPMTLPSGYEDLSDGWEPGTKQVKGFRIILLALLAERGGFEIKTPNGKWAVLEEAYLDEDQEQLEIMAGDHHYFIDSSEDLLIRRLIP